jgi:hypothetical protein
MASPQRSRDGDGSGGRRLHEKILFKLQSDEMQKRKEQAGKALKSFGNQLQKINLGKLIDQMESDQTLADSLEQLNVRMKEECERQEIRREAEARTLEVILDHLEVFLQERPNASYEDWIEDLHPENAYQGKLLPDIQEIDQRFYVFESDHRRVWNKAMEKLGGNEHRIIQARTKIWGNVQSHHEHQQVDLLSESVEFPLINSDGINQGVAGKSSSVTETESIDVFAPENSGVEDRSGYSDFVLVDGNNEAEEDLIKF